MEATLVNLFVAVQGKDVHPSIDAPGLQSALVDTIARARSRYPTVTVTDEDFTRHLATRVDRQKPPTVSLHELRTDDLLLAYACTVGDRAALMLLESECLRGAQSALGKRGISSEVIEEANQNVRERLIVGDGVPKLLEYDGRGDLKSWVRVVLVREAIYLSKRGQKEASLSYDLLAMPSAQEDPETAYFKAHYRMEYKEAFETAVTELTARERALLRQQIVLGMSIDDIGTIYQVHRATAARWVQAARDELLAKTRLQLTLRLKLPRKEIEELLRLIESQLVVSMSRLFPEG